MGDPALFGRGGARRGAGRPAKAPEERRAKQLVVLVTPSVEEELRRGAAAAGVSLAEHVRRIIAAGLKAQ